MAAREIKPGIKYVGVQDWDRELFDDLIPLPDGTSYNSYLIEGSEKTALLDTADPAKREQYIEKLKNAGPERLDYIISHHAEQDHSGLIPDVLGIYPEAKVVTNAKCKGFLMDLLHIPEDRFLVVGDRDTLSLGNRTLEFILAPWVHWPETMFTYLREDRVLFTCDFLGSHAASSELFVTDEAKVKEDAKRYYAEIMMPFRASIRGHLKKIEELDVDIIAPSHGPVYQNPQFILDAYRDWISDDVKNEVVIAFVSMHGSTRKMVEYLTDALIERGIVVKPFNLTKADLGQIAMSLVDAATIVLATPTVLAGAHPSALYAASLVNALRPKLRFAAIIGSYNWGGRAVDQIKGLLPNLKVELLEPVLVKGHPDEEAFKRLDGLADKIFKKHSDADIVN